MKWIRPSGSVIELADTENLNEFAKANGWKPAEGRKILPAPKEDTVTRVAATKAVAKVKRKRRTKAQMEEAKNGGRSTSN